MGPLVPYIISNEFNLVVALIVGFGFGFILEQAGFSSTQKLVGLFYGYDFTVLKVFFTAGVTAMIGVLVFAHTGLLDLSLIYVNPTFLWSAIVGGAIMGLGFIIGGFCPGTSICAASIGKLDAIAFVAGSVGGIFFFAEKYSWFEQLYLAQDWGPVLINEQLGISKSAFAFLLTAAAFLAFYFTHLIENKVNKYPTEVTSKRARKYMIAEAIAFLLIALVAFAPSKKEIIQQKIAKAEKQVNFPYNEVSSDKLAFEIANHSGEINIIDVRSADEFNAYHLPLAINIPLEQLSQRQWQLIFNQRIKANYFYADSDSIARRAYLLANYLGKSSNFLLKETTEEFRQLYSSIVAIPETAGKDEINILHYRNELVEKINRLVDAMSKLNQPVKQKQVKIKGGCS